MQSPAPSGCAARAKTQKFMACSTLLRVSERQGRGGKLFMLRRPGGRVSLMGKRVGLADAAVLSPTEYSV